ncbi:YwmB family TATA-box binding protein [Natronincola ferrireducens]|uniref:TATA-box binding n=1 Tax=Natronincola ferrireducens TaxID=393762 RepID=A0A1G8XHF1_9FIRM|nr:YwmB family TATA-box binding protein [Natronincola ferrireducens]SDJ89856.1 TATA-box binding [Natronincola ferrireducens]
MKKICNIGLTILLFLSFFYIASAITSSSNETTIDSPIEFIFAKSGADILESNINTTLEVPNTLWTEEEVYKIKEEIKKQLGLDNIKEVRLEDEDQLFYNNGATEKDENILFIHEFSDCYMKQIIATNTDKNGDTITFKVYSAEIQEEKTSYIIIDIIQNKRYKEIVEKSNQNQLILGRYGKNIETTINLVGTYDKKMSWEESKEKIDQLIDSVKGRKVEEVGQELYISTTAYTPIIPEAIHYGNNKVNLHLAMRYNHYEGKTYLYIANPLITLTY